MPPKKENLPVTSSEWDLGRALKLRFQGISHGELAKMFNIPKSTLQARLKPFESKVVETKVFRENRADILAAQQARVLMSLSEDKIKKASAKDTAMVFGILYDKERLERGQSTSNVSLLSRLIDEAPDLPE